MAKSIYITGIEPRTGKALISLVIIEILKRHFKTVNFFRPIANIRPDSEIDSHIELMHHQFKLKTDVSDMYAYDMQTAGRYLANNNGEALFSKILSSYKKLESKSDFVVCEGTDFTRYAQSFSFDFNAEIANNLGCEIIVIARGLKRTANEIVESLDMALNVFKQKRSKVLGVVINRVSKKEIPTLKQRLKQLKTDLKFTFIIPEHDELSKPTVAEIADYIGADVLWGKDQLERKVERYLVAAKPIVSFLKYQSNKPNALVVVPGDREDVIMGCCLTEISEGYSQFAGLLLTTGEKPKPVLKQILDGLPHTFPILATKKHTFDTAVTLEQAHFRTTAHQERKISLALDHFSKYINANLLSKTLASSDPHIMTPYMFEYTLAQLALHKKRHIVLPESIDDRILQAADQLLQRELVDITVLGSPTYVAKQLKKLGLSCPGLKVLNPAKDKRCARYAKKYYELRKHKNVNMAIARDRMHNPTYFGTMMVYMGEADGMVSGATNTTADTVRPALEFIKTKPGCPLVSSVFLMCLEDKVLVYGDCAVIPDPDAQQLANIAIAAADTAKTFGVEPKVAMLSYSSGSSGSGASVAKVREATAIVKKRKPKLIVDGPIQYDAAVDAATGKKKMPNSPVAGQATVLIFPDLNTGNNTYKAVQRETGAIAIGPVLQGLNKPVNDLSRGCTVKDIINTVLITAVQAQGNKR